MEGVYEGDNSSGTQLAAVASRLGHLLEYDARLGAVLEVIAGAQAQAQEAVYMLRDYQQRLDPDPQRFKQIEQRLDAVHASAPKDRVTPDTLPDAPARARARLEQLTPSG